MTNAQQYSIEALSNVPTLRLVWDDFKRHRKLKPLTIKDYEKRLREVSDWFDLPITSINRRMIIDRFQTLTERGPAQANLVMKVLRSVLTYAGARYEDHQGNCLITNNPVAVIKHLRMWNKISRRQTIIDSNDLPRWWSAVHKMENTAGRDLLIVLLLSGLRKTEVCNLEWRDVNFNTKTLTIRETKNGLEHVIPMGEYLRSFLWKRFQSQQHIDINCKYVFPGRGTDRPVTSLSKVVSRAVQLSGVSFCIHDTRRCFATQGMLANVQTYMLKRILNHRLSGDVTNGYLVFGVDDMRESMQQIEDRILMLSRKPILPPKSASSGCAYE